MFENAFNTMDRVMRNDEGLASELDYAEQTSWLLFLKYLDDMEKEWQDEAATRNRCSRRESMYTGVQTLHATYSRKLTDLTHLRQSLLQNAFSGELT